MRSAKHFNPRSREGSDPINVSTITPFAISIHAPAKGATSSLSPVCRRTVFQSTLPRRERLWYVYLCRYRRSISIHAPAKGATAEQCGRVIRITISIHAPAKGATRFCRGYPHCKRISIHAPAKGATTGELATARHIKHFNPRSREGSDILVLVDLHFNCRFQSTLPRRERRSEQFLQLRNSKYFNPRSREGSDL